MKLNTPVAAGQAVTVSHEPSSPLGLTAKVAPSWGGQARGGAEALWGNQMAYGMGSHQIAHSGETDHPFRWQTDHLFRRKPITRSDANRSPVGAKRRRTKS